MAAFLNDDVMDAALDEIKDNATALHICSGSVPVTYTAAITASLGNKSTPGFSGPGDGDVSGRKITMSAITDGSITATGTAAAYAIVDGSRLLAAQLLASSQVVTSGNTFTLTAADIEIPDPSA